MAEVDIPAALSILDSALGAGFVDDEELGSYTSNPGKAAFVADIRGRVRAVATGFAASNAAARVATPEDQRDAVLHLVPELGGDAGVGVLKSVAVAPEARKGGLGKAVSEAVVQQLAAARPEAVLSLGWTDEDGCHIEGLLGSLGFQPRGDLPAFWRADSIRHGYSCPSCGHPCACTARVFVLLLRA